MKYDKSNVIENDNIIEVFHLTKDYGSNRGIFDVNLNVKKGEVFGFLGPNGAGKSTTIRHLMGFCKADKGTCKIFGVNTFDKYYEILNNIGYIPGEITLPSGLTGYEFIKMMQDMHNIHNNEMLNKLLKMFEINDATLKSETKKMSLGYKRKLAIICAFMSDPDVLILDEPTSGLDPVMQERFISFIHEEKERGKTILLSSHIFSEIDSTCDRVSIIKDGKIVDTFITSDLKHASLKKYTITFKNLKSRHYFENEAKQIASLNIIKINGEVIELFVNDRDLNELVSLLSSLDIISFSNKTESLEDYFMKFYKEDKNFKGALK